MIDSIFVVGLIGFTGKAFEFVQQGNLLADWTAAIATAAHGAGACFVIAKTHKEFSVGHGENKTSSCIGWNGFHSSEISKSWCRVFEANALAFKHA